MKTYWRIFISLLIALLLIWLFGSNLIRYLMTELYVATYIVVIVFVGVALIVSLLLYLLLGLGAKKE